VDEELLVAFVNAIDGTNVDTRFVLDADAGFSDDVGHTRLEPSSVAGCTVAKIKGDRC
jgi:hypothetical protein